MLSPFFLHTDKYILWCFSCMGPRVGQSPSRCPGRTGWSFPSCGLLNVAMGGRQRPVCSCARWVIRVGPSCFITRSIIEGSTALKGDTRVIVPECRFARCWEIAWLQWRAHSSSHLRRICLLKDVKIGARRSPQVALCNSVFLTAVQLPATAQGHSLCNLFFLRLTREGESHSHSIISLLLKIRTTSRVMPSSD